MTNPYITPDDYLEGYRKSAETIQLNKDYVDVEKLCYQVFENSKNGKKLLEYLKKQFIFTPTPGQIGKDYDQACIYQEGLRYLILSFISGIESYKQRVKSDAMSETSEGIE